MRNDYIVKKLYISFVVVSILSALTATAGMLIDNIVVGRFLGSDALGAMGIIGPISLVFSAFGNICSGGGAARAAQAIGKGETERLKEIFTATMIFVPVVGMLLTVAGLLFTPQIAGLLGAKDNLMDLSVDYLRGFFLGAIPTIMMTALMGFVKIDGSPRLPLICIVVMTVTNITLDLMMVLVFHQGMFGMALATSISYCFAVAVGCTHFMKKDCSLHLVKPKRLWQELGAMVTTGAPTAISRICDTLKVLILNNMLVAVVGVGAVTALNVRTQANSFFGAFILGLAQASVPIVGMFYGEEDRTALRDTLRTTVRIGLVINGMIAILLFLAAPVFVAMLGVTETETAGMSVLAVRLFAVGMPFALLNMVMMSYYQSTRNTGLATMICILQSLVFTPVISGILIVPLGTMGVWIAFLAAEIFTILTVVVCCTVRNRGIPHKLDDFMRLADGFGGNGKDRLELSIGNSMDEVMKISQGISKFGRNRKISEKTLNTLSLCIEEMAGNVVRHSFKPGEKRWFDVMVLEKEDTLVVRLRDNGSAFDPTQYLESPQGQEPDGSYGIRLIAGLADGMQYRRVMELNNTIIVLKKNG